jgi:transcription elongation GreA/GreB family factor
LNKPIVNKKDLLTQLITHLQQEIDATLNAVNEAHALASHEQSKPENQYDTLALEAAYLAHGQSERIAELQRQVMLLNHFEFLDYSEESRITVGALVCIQELEDDSLAASPQWFWVLPVAGGQVLSLNVLGFSCDSLNSDSLNDIEVRTITAKAPLAEKLLGCNLGDEVVLNLGHKKKQFEVIELL